MDSIWAEKIKLMLLKFLSIPEYGWVFLLMDSLVPVFGNRSNKPLHTEV